MDADSPPLAVLFSHFSSSAAFSLPLSDRLAVDAINASFDVLRTAVEKYRGAVVKTAGNELLARFASADLALQAASAMQASMRGRADGLAVKIGFTFGPVIQEREDVFGDTVNLAARIAALANPKQILTAGQAVERLSPYLRSTCRSLYTTSVRGRTEKISLYEVLWHQDKGTTAVSEAGPREQIKPATLALSCHGKTWNMDESREALVAGRDPASDIVVAGDKVSRQHARIFPRQGKFVIADQSANGTFVRMQHRQEILLHREDFVLLGRGSIGLGLSVAESGDETIAFDIT